MGASLTLACSQNDTPAVELDWGTQRYRFVPETAFAEYWELSGDADQLKITLASYRTSCEAYRGPEEGEVIVTLTARVPPQESIGIQEFPWKGLGEDPRIVTEPQVIPFVRLATSGRALAPGGSFRLTRLEKQIHGVVEGEFVFSEPRATEGEVDRGSRSSGDLRGSFSVRLCRLSLDPSRNTAQTSALQP